MIIKAKHHFVIHPIFKLYSALMIKKHFSRVVVQKSNMTVDKNRAVLLLSNHCSWWDGFWQLYLNMKLFKKKYHFMMLEEQLKKHWYFNYTGGFSVKKSARSVLETIQYTAQLLADPANLVLMFPQGGIESMHKRELSFDRGVEKIIEKTRQSDIQIVFLVNSVDYFINKRPILYHYLTTYSNSDISYETIEKNYNTFYNECISQQTALKV